MIKASASLPAVSLFAEKAAFLKSGFNVILQDDINYKQNSEEYIDTMSAYMYNGHNDTMSICIYR